jgi:uncharacterized membrane protein
VPRCTNRKTQQMSIELMVSTILVIATVAFVTWLNKQESRVIKACLDWFPAILFAYVIPAIFTHASGMDLSKVELHDLSKNWIIPFAILTVMSALSFDQLKIVGVKPIILFVSGSFVIATLPALLVYIFIMADGQNQELFMTQGFWKGLVPIVGGWIGGSTSQLVLKELAQTPEALFLSILVLDNILVNIWTILMFQFIKRSDQLNRLWKIESKIKLIDTDALWDTKNAPISLILAIITSSLILGYFVLPTFLSKVVAFSITGLLLGNFVKTWNHKLVLKWGGISIVLIMAILGLKLDFNNLSLPITLVILVVIWLLMHFVITLLLARVMRINIAWVPIASMANLGGISTAPAVTSAYRKELMPHAIILAILSMVSGTAWGMFTIYLFGLMQ